MLSKIKKCYITAKQLFNFQNDLDNPIEDFQNTEFDIRTSIIGTKFQNLSLST